METAPTTPRATRATRAARAAGRHHAGVAGLLGALALLAAACSSGSTAAPSTSAAPSTTGTTLTPARQAGLPPIRHVFVITLENEGYAATFGTPSSDPYLATTLPSEGALLQQYYGIGHFSNDNYIALVSGQAPNPANQADCQVFADFPAGLTTTPSGQMNGSGCVFPTSVPTVAGQLDAAHLTWKGYMEDMGNIPSRESAVCAHPAVGAVDTTQRAVPGDGYATRHDPFVYFHSVIDNTARCDARVVPLGSTSARCPPRSRPAPPGSPPTWLPSPRHPTSASSSRTCAATATTPRA